MGQVWRPIPGYEGIYEVSSFGKIRRIYYETKLSKKDIKIILLGRKKGMGYMRLAQLVGVTPKAIQHHIRARRQRTRLAPRILKGSFDSKKYLKVDLYHKGKHRTWKIHQLVCLAFLGPTPHGMNINHLNGIKTDNHLSNLEFSSYSSNILHAYHVLNRNRAKGSTIGSAKITEEDIPAICSMRTQGMTYATIGNHFGIGVSAVCKIVHKQTWAHIHR